MLTVRYPKIDFSSCFPHWTPHAEFAQYFNSVSMLPCGLEPFAIKVFNKVKGRLHPTRDAQLIREVEWFIGQESQHFRQHNKFNKCFKTDHYPRMAKIEKTFADELNSYIASESPEFCLGYVEGFEAWGIVWAQLWFEELDEYKQGSLQEPLELFSWHYSEEFEHREIAFRLYMALAARGSLWRRIYYGYFYRVWVTRFAINHMAKHANRARDYLLEIDRAAMPPEERAASIERENAMLWRIGALLKKGTRALYSPFYHPARKRTPRGLAEVLDRYARA
jgi:predicted metal-dependent hydrolase